MSSHQSNTSKQLQRRFRTGACGNQTPITKKRIEKPSPTGRLHATQPAIQDLPRKRSRFGQFFLDKILGRRTS